MVKEKQMSDLEIVAKLKAGKPFVVPNAKQRSRVLNAKRFTELPNTVTTRENKDRTFTVFFIPNNP